MKNAGKWFTDSLLLPLLGAAAVVLIWSIASATFAKDLPSPGKAWEDSKLYITEPFAYRGELDQGIAYIQQRGTEAGVDPFGVNTAKPGIMGEQ